MNFIVFVTPYKIQIEIQNKTFALFAAIQWPLYVAESQFLKKVGFPLCFCQKLHLCRACAEKPSVIRVVCAFVPTFLSDILTPLGSRR